MARLIPGAHEPDYRKLILVSNHGEYEPVMSWKETVAHRLKLLRNRPCRIVMHSAGTKPQHVNALTKEGYLDAALDLPNLDSSNTLDL